MGSPNRIGRLLGIGVIGVAALLVLGLLPDNDGDAPLGTPARVEGVVRGTSDASIAAAPTQAATAVPSDQYRARLAARLMFIHSRRPEDGGTVYPSYPSIRDSQFATEVADAFVPMSAMFDTTTLLDATDRGGSVTPLRIDPLPNADSLLRSTGSALTGANVDMRFDVHGSLAGHVAPSWIVALAPGGATPLPLTPWGTKGRERATLEGKRLALLVSDDTVPVLRNVPFRLVSYDRFDIDASHYVIVHAVREAKRHPGDVESVDELVTLIGQSLGATDDFAPIWSSVQTSPAADLTLAPVVAALRMGSLRRPVLMLEVQPGDSVCSGDRHGYFLALMDDGRWRDVGSWGPGC